MKNKNAIIVTVCVVIICACTVCDVVNINLNRKLFTAFIDYSSKDSKTEQTEDIVTDEMKDYFGQYLSKDSFVIKGLYEVGWYDVSYTKDIMYDSESGYATCTWTFNNSDLTYVIYKNFKETESEAELGDLCNKYGSDYCNVYFDNGLPSNSKELYEIISNWYPDLAGRYFHTSYKEGDSQLDLDEYNKGEEYSIKL